VQVALKAAEAAPRRVPGALKKVRRRVSRNPTSPSPGSSKRSPAEAAEAGQRNSAGGTKRLIGLKEDKDRRSLSRPRPGKEVEDGFVK